MEAAKTDKAATARKTNDTIENENVFQKANEEKSCQTRVWPRSVGVQSECDICVNGHVSWLR